MVLKTKFQSLALIETEISIAKSLRHPNIVQLFDAHERKDGFPCVTMELCTKGSFWSMLIREKKTPALSLKQKAHILTGASRGMAYLHSRKPPIVHRDLRSAKVLVDQSFNAKVSIFGVNQRQEDAKIASGQDGYGGSRAAIPYMAPELLVKGPHTEKVDVYAFAMVIFEALGAKTPFTGVEQDQIISSVTNHRVRPKLPRKARDTLAKQPLAEALHGLMVRRVEC
jgi:serine/threonine-protein kinase CTR1